MAWNALIHSQEPNCSSWSKGIAKNRIGLPDHRSQECRMKRASAFQDLYFCACSESLQSCGLATVVDALLTKQSRERFVLPGFLRSVD